MYSSKPKMGYEEQIRSVYLDALQNRGRVPTKQSQAAEQRPAMRTGEAKDWWFRKNQAAQGSK